MKLVRNIVAFLRIMAFIVITLSGAILYTITLPLGPPAQHFFKKYWWARGCCWAFSLDCTLAGDITTHKPCFFVSNHLGYLDIVTIGGVSEVSFAAKAEMKNWPFFGTISRLADTVFISRNPRHSKQVLQQISGRLKEGRNLILFPEGTSWDGSEVKPFKSSPFGVMDDPELHDILYVQPLSVAYITKKNREERAPTPFSWSQGYPLWKHIWETAGRGGAEVRIVAYEPVAVKDFSDRRELAQHCFEIVEKGYFESINRPVKKYDPARDPTLGAAAALPR